MDDFYFIYLFFFLAVVGLLLGLFSSCGEWGPLSSCSVRASAGGFSCGTWALGLSACGSQA